jgi:hypothetical protein
MHYDTSNPLIRGTLSAFFAESENETQEAVSGLPATKGLEPERCREDW